jgi:hypothetical protein
MLRTFFGPNEQVFRRLFPSRLPTKKLYGPNLAVEQRVGIAPSPNLRPGGLLWKDGQAGHSRSP